jgi:uncharacterized protein (UPF0332 family)
MKTEPILAEWRRAQDSLLAAEILVGEGCFADAVSRTYYSIFHAAKAALLVFGVACSSHPSVRRMFGLHLIKPDKIEKEFAVHLAEGFDDRLDADYNPEKSFSKKEARQELRRTRAFVRRIRDFLLENGFHKRDLRRTSKKNKKK